MFDLNNDPWKPEYMGIEQISNILMMPTCGMIRFIHQKFMSEEWVSTTLLINQIQKLVTNTITPNQFTHNVGVTIKIIWHLPLTRERMLTDRL